MSINVKAVLEAQSMAVPANWLAGSTVHITRMASRESVHIVRFGVIVMCVPYKPVGGVLCCFLIWFNTSYLEAHFKSRFRQFQV